jgi:hypothetical protein
MIKDNKPFMYVGYIFATTLIGATTLPSEGAVCLDSHLLCAPLPIQMGDLPNEDGPQAPRPTTPLGALASSTASAFTGSSAVPIYASRRL